MVKQWERLNRSGELVIGYRWHDGNRVVVIEDVTKAKKTRIALTRQEIIGLWWYAMKLAIVDVSDCVGTLVRYKGRGQDMRW